MQHSLYYINKCIDSHLGSLRNTCVIETSQLSELVYHVLNNNTKTYRNEINDWLQESHVLWRNNSTVIIPERDMEEEWPPREFFQYVQLEQKNPNNVFVKKEVQIKRRHAIIRLQSNRRCD